MTYHWDFPGSSMGLPSGSDSKACICNAGDPSSVPRSGRSPGEGHGNPLQYFCLGNPMNRGAWSAMVHGIKKSHTWWATNTQNDLSPTDFKRNNITGHWSWCTYIIQIVICTIEELAARVVHYTTVHSWATLVTEIWNVLLRDWCCLNKP